jgi:hypothetical protein
MSSLTIGFLFLLLMAAAYAGLFVWLRKHDQPRLRVIPAIEKLRIAMPEAAEDGRTVHVALGTAGLADANAMQTLAGLDVLDYLGEQSIVSSHTPVVTTADPTTLLAAQTTASRSLRAHDQAAQFDPLNIQFIGGTLHAPAAYAAGVIDLLERRTVAASFALGQFGDEYLLINEAAGRGGTPEVAGTGNPQGLALMALAAQHVLVGEELFAAGAYLKRGLWNLAGLAASDLMRWLIAAAILTLVTLKTIRLF